MQIQNSISSDIIVQLEIKFNVLIDVHFINGFVLKVELRIYELCCVIGIINEKPIYVSHQFFFDKNKHNL